MTQHFVFLLLGIGNGAVFAALAVALVLTFRSSGVINFATGSVALLTAYLYAFLRQGELIVLIPGFPTTLDLGGELPMPVALAISVVVAGFLGLVLHLFVFRPLRSAPPVAKAVASLGVSLFITALIAARMGTTIVAVQPIFPTDLWTAGSLRVPSDRAYLALTVIAIAVVLTLLFRFTKFGLATRAAAESEKGAYVSGVSPDRVAAWNWVLSSAIAGLVGVLIAPIVPLIPASYTLFIVPALAAAIIGRFQFVLWAVVAGLGIGMLQSETQYLASTIDWLPSSGLPELVPLVLILLVLVVRARPLPGRGAIIVQTLGRAPRPRRLLLPTVVPSLVALAGLYLLTNQWRNGLISTLIFAIIGLSIIVVTGYAGQVSLAQLPLAGVGAFLLPPIADQLSIPFPFAPILAAIGAMVIGVVIGLPALRIRGLTVAVVTFALAFALEALWFRNGDLVGEGLRVPNPEIFGVDLGVGIGTDFPRSVFGIVCLAVLVIVGVGVAKLRTSRLGSQMLAVRANERSAAAAGVDVVRVKLIAFALGAFIAGLGGALLAYKSGTVTFEPYTAFGGLAFFGVVYLTGITSVSGGLLAGVSAVGGLVYVLVSEVASTALWYNVVAAVLLVLTVIFNPEGIVGPVHSALESRRSRKLRGAAQSIVGSQYEAPAPAAAVAEARTPAADADPALLEVEDLRVRYGGVVAVSDLSFTVRENTIVGLIGPNGAGKTTAIDAISGFAPAAGSVTLSGTRLDGMKPHERIRSGLGRTFQAIELYEDLTVRENVVVGLTAGDGGEGEARLNRTLGLLGLTDVADRPAGELSQGQRQLVSIARALVGLPKVLLLDEPAGGLDTVESHWLGDRLREIRNFGVTIVMVEHDMSLVLSLCDEIHVLNFGEVIASGTPAEIRSDPKVAQAYLGTTHADLDAHAGAHEVQEETV
ncbi:branched-chain amino acid ABC transporter permease/ATP-binding protein [uncultured Modestobacter sp.]|uniref:branched-chain amino acid ABC transporter permease/ATP-binding protein n=1 Tax=uncultured Modestobacter sp. TaxID=380048 RepID=UPI0026277B2F|nr:branched-chain amino acid ABC transporter permease/ATP-binding protein [uncultured Modestobacter sp.]